MGYTIPAVNTFSMLSSLGDTIAGARANDLLQQQDLQQRNEAAQNNWLASGGLGAPPAPITSPQGFLGGIFGNTGRQQRLPSYGGGSQTPAQGYSGSKTPTQEQQFAYNFFTSNGSSPHEAAAKIATLTGESGPHLNTAFNQGGGRAGGDSEDRSGVANWNGDRVGKLRNFAASRGLDPLDRATQLAFVDQEFNQRGLSGSPSQDVGALTSRYVGQFERPAVNNAAQRVANAPGVNAYTGGRPVQLAGPVPTPDTISPGGQGGLQTGNYGGQPYTSAVPGGQQSAAGYGSNSAPVPMTGPYGAPSFTQGAAPLPPQRPEGNNAGQDIPLPPPRPPGIGVPSASPQQQPQQQGFLGMLASALGSGNVVPDGRGGFVPSTNSRVNPDGSFAAPTQLAGPVPTPDTRGAPSMAPSPGAVGPNGVPMAGSGATTTPMGQRIPQLGAGLSNYQILQMLDNPHSQLLGKALLEQRLKSGETQLIDLPVNGQDGTFAGTIKAFASRDGQVTPVPGGAIDTTKVKEKTGNQANWQVVGEDQYGRKQYGYPPKPGEAPAAAAAPAAETSSLDLHGPEYIKTLDPNIQPQVVAIIEGRAPYPTGMLLKTPYGQKLAAMVTQADPSFESGNATARVATRKEFLTGGPNSVAGTITSGNAAVQHLGELSNASENLGNSSIPIWNTLANAAATGTGSAKVTNFNNIVARFGEEATKFYRGIGGSEADVQRDIANLSPNMSPEQLRGAIQTQVNLMTDKIQALQTRWHQSMGPLVPDFPIVSDKTQGVIEKINGRAQPSEAARALNGRAGQPSVRQPAPGDNYGGYIFKGGDPADQNSWQRP